VRGLTSQHIIARRRLERQHAVAFINFFGDSSASGFQPEELWPATGGRRLRCMVSWYSGRRNWSGVPSGLLES
jgi:hypothetical protein